MNPQGHQAAVSQTSYQKPRITRLKPSGKSAQKSSGKPRPATSGKVVANPEVESSGKSHLPLPPQNLPLTANDEDDLQFHQEIEDQQKGWRLEKNSNGYWRWRWQLKDDGGQSVTYVNEGGNVGYKRGSKYVKIKQAKIEAEKRGIH